ncbi:hypothetical protein INT44_007646 [Umbelopsis vinacea]|uniref:Phospholipid/glycerol acyltransferase domain-containing protein n=1 Tax=Umbelopsis vinacea TaxID=44442 RepID=A0A8H7PJJ8_9FUNG|nr:hypothetical protein INT44_007646 [Umbelopsis vinacea]
MPFGTSHEAIVQVSRLALWSFYRRIEVQGEENMPEDGPVIIAATHHNMIVDPSVLSNTMPHGRRCHYWGKHTMFSHPLAKRILDDSGVLPVDRTTKNNTLLYASTYQALRVGEVVAVFPEGTSHTLPRMGEFKDGVSWAALEYAKSLVDDNKPNPDGSIPKPAVVVPVAIVYDDKASYRSNVIVRYGEPITMDKYLPLFLSEGKPAVKQLSRDVEEAIVRMTINAPDWLSYYSAYAARDILFSDKTLVSDFVPVTQSLIKSLNNWAQKEDEVKLLQLDLQTYHQDLRKLKLRDQHIAKYDEETITAVSTIAQLIQKSLMSLVDLPLFLPGLIAHLPLYIAGYYAGKTEIYMEVRAQNKIFLGMLLAILTYIWVFFWSWFNLFGASFWGLFVAVGVTATFMWYHVVSIDERYDNWKDLLGRWRLFDAFVMGRGMWKRRDRIQEVKKLRQKCQRGLQAFIRQHHVEDPDLDYVYLSVRSRAKELNQISSAAKGRKATSQMKRARSYKWALEE